MNKEEKVDYIDKIIGGYPGYFKNTVKNGFRKILPKSALNLIKKFPKDFIYYKLSKLSKQNSKFKDIYNGRRCFILCNGPSINKQDLRPLKNEIVFSAGCGYYHKDYNNFRPRYHCVPGLIYSSLFNYDTAIAWFKEMHQALRDAELFLGASEARLERRYNLFPGRKVNYLCMKKHFSGKSNKIIDISGIIPSPQSAAIMCLMVAMYMGFKKIYLVGAEHDAHITGVYKNFYTEGLLRGTDCEVTFDGKIKNLESTRQATQELMSQYRILKNIANKQGVAIYNATLGGALEVFPRSNLDNILRGRNGNRE